MLRLQDSTAPLVFKAASGEAPAAGATRDGGRLSFCADVRSLDGMQKEAVVRQLAPPGPIWRMVSDEGPYLNGTDLAPFPLGFFAAGLQFCYMTQLRRLACAEGVAIRTLLISQDTRYTMTGSALRGDMTGSGVPVELDVQVEIDAPRDRVAMLIARAVAESPAHAIMRDRFTNTFALCVNGTTVPLTDVPASPAAESPDRLMDFETVRPAPSDSVLRDILTKTGTVEVRHGIPGGAGSSLQAEQKRTLHVRAEGRLVGDDVLETRIRLLQPLGSSFRFLGDATGGDMAPPPLAYLSAGVGFCYMTQLGRYARITKQQVRATRIVQYTAYTQPGSRGGPASAEPVDTHVFLDTDEPADVARTSVRMGEQTCFLHGSMREAYPTIVRARLNGTELSLPTSGR